MQEKGCTCLGRGTGGGGGCRERWAFAVEGRADKGPKDGETRGIKASVVAVVYENVGAETLCTVLPYRAAPAQTLKGTRGKREHAVTDIRSTYKDESKEEVEEEVEEQGPALRTGTKTNQTSECARNILRKCTDPDL